MFETALNTLEFQLLSKLAMYKPLFSKWLARDWSSEFSTINHIFYMNTLLEQ
jgi:hypothetical protein